MFICCRLSSYVLAEMGESGDNQNATVALQRTRTKSNRVAFRRILHDQPSSGFLSELRNPGLWNDFVVEMVFRVKPLASLAMGYWSTCSPSFPVACECTPMWQFLLTYLQWGSKTTATVFCLSTTVRQNVCNKAKKKHKKSRFLDFEKKL